MPLLVVVIKAKSGVYSVWFFSGYSKIFDLFFSTGCILSVCLGIYYFKGRKGLNIIILSLIAFCILEVLSWQGNVKKFDSLLECNQTYSLVLIKNDGGAFTSQNYVRLFIFEKVLGLFYIKHDTKIEFERVREARVRLTSPIQLKIELIAFKGKYITYTYNLPNIYSDRLLMCDF